MGTSSDHDRPAPKGIYIICLIILALLLISNPGRAEASKTISVTYCFDFPVIKEKPQGEDIFHSIIIQGLSSGGNPGEPLLPISGARVLIPAGYKSTKIDISYPKIIDLGSGYTPIPAGQAYPLSRPETAIERPMPNPQIYSSHTPFPAQIYKEQGTQIIRGAEILILKLFPVQFHPYDGGLRFNPEIRVTITLEESGKSHRTFRGLDNDLALIGKMTDNKPELHSYANLASNKILDDPYSLLILTTNELKPAFELLKEHHDINDMPTRIFTLGDIGSSNHIDIREFIRNAYLTNGIEYVLIGGDDDIIPAPDLFVRSWKYSGAEIAQDMPGDLYYGCLDGTWNFDNDTFWGEPADGEDGGEVDLVHEVYVGRAPAGDIIEATNFVSKTIAYTQSESMALNRVLMLGEDLGYGTVGRWGGNYMDDLIDSCSVANFTYGIPWDYYHLEKLYERYEDWDSDDLITRINAGVHLVNHMGHGSPITGMKLDIFLTNELNNTEYPFIYSQACDMGQFDNMDCMAEYLSSKNTAGVFATVMNARLGWAVTGSTDGPSQRFHREFIDAFYNQSENITSLGRALADSKEDNLYRLDEICMRWCYYELNLFGDPSISLKDGAGCLDGDHDYICDFICGDVNDDDDVNLLDIVYLIDYKFKAGPEPIDYWMGDVNGDGIVDLLDITFLIDFKFQQGTEPHC